MGIDKHYNDFGGIDSRSNVMKQNPKFARGGSKNFQFKTTTANGDFDVTGKRRGFQKKSQSTYAAEMGLIEYKFKDINTGQARIEILGVARDGKLRKRFSHRLKIARSAGTVTSYSLYYDTTAVAWRVEFLNSSFVRVATTTFSNTTTLDQLKTALTALAITGLTFTVIDDDNTSITSSELAYLLDVCYRREILNSDSAYNEMYFWTLVETPNSSQVLFDYIASSDWRTNGNFEGISYYNSNNAVYITDGGFPIKYDGFSAYRAGMPKIFSQYNSGANNYSGFQVSRTGADGSVDAGVHGVLFQAQHKDPTGVVVLGLIQPMAGVYEVEGYNYINNSASDSIPIYVPRFAQTDTFPVYACEVSTTTSLTLGTVVIPVETGHNLKIGQCLRVQKLSGVYTTIEAYVPITAVSASTVSVLVNSYLANLTLSVTDDFTYNACYVPDALMGYAENNNSTGVIEPYGVSYKIYRSAAGTQSTGPYYLERYVSIPLTVGQEYTTKLTNADTTLDNRPVYDESADQGEDLPRACRYLSSWQGQVAQAGRPWDAQDLIDDLYPSLYSALSIEDYLTNLLFRVSEAHMCDFQSVYFEDPNYAEGFSQSGLAEESFDTPFQDEIRGMAENKESFFVFKQRSMGLLSGTLATGDFTKEILESDMGCAAHNSIQDVQGSLIWLDESYGFCSVIAGRTPIAIGWPVQDAVKKNKFLNGADKLRFAGAKAVNHRIEDLYICYIPQGSNDVDNETTVPYPGSESVCFVFDYSQTQDGNRNSWYVWKEINAAGGVLSINDRVFTSSLVDPAGNQYTNAQKISGSIYDYSDDIVAISLNYLTSWLNYLEYSIDKHFTRLAVHSVLGNFVLTVKQYINYKDTSVADYNLSFSAASATRNNGKLTMSLNSAKILALSLGFENSTIYEDVSINGFDIQVEGEYSSDEVVK